MEQGNRRAEEERKLLILKDKEREVRLNEIRLKEFRKLATHGRGEGKGEPVERGGRGGGRRRGRRWRAGGSLGTEEILSIWRGTTEGDFLLSAAEYLLSVGCKSCLRRG